MAPSARAADAGNADYMLFAPVPDDKVRDLDADRPDKTNTPHTVDAGHLQAEIGLIDYTYDQFRLSGARANAEAFTTGEFEMRLGVSDRLELNLFLDSYSQQREQDHVSKTTSHAAGLGDLTIGGKLNFWGEESDEPWSTALAVQPLLKLPTAATNVGNGHTEATLGFPFLLNLPADFHLGYQPTFSWERDSLNARYVAGWQNSVALDHSLVENLDLYLEYWIEATTEAHLETRQSFDFGLLYQVTPNLLLDTGFNFGLTRASDDFQWLSGFTIRF